MRISVLAMALALLPAGWTFGITSTTVTFQRGDANAYDGVTELRVSMNAGNDGTDGGTIASWGIDGYRADDPVTPANEFSPDQPSLTRFDNIFGAGGGEIPLGATILDATLRLKTTNGSSANTNGPWSVANLSQPFTSATRYVDFPSADPLGFRGPWWQDGYSSRPAAGFGSMIQNDIGTANIRPLVQQWSSDPEGDNNFGFAIQAGYTGTSDGWNYYTSGYSVVADRPKLSVTYTTDPVAINTFQRDLNGYAGDTMAWVRCGSIQSASATNPDPSVDDVTYDGFTGMPTVSGTSTITPAPDTLTSFQQFLDGPAFGVDPGVVTSPDDFGLFKFNNVFGGGAGQAPADKSVAKAWLVLTTGDTSVNSRSTDKWAAYAMQRDWDATSLYSEDFGATPGLQPEDGDIAATALDIQQGMTTGSEVWFDVTGYLEGVRTGTTDFGLAVLHDIDTTDGWQIHLNGSPVADARPRLVVISDLAAAGVAGDYNGDNVVDARDYVIWRKDPASHGGDPGGYTAWRNNFGFGTPGAGSGSLADGAAVPEPTAWILSLVAAFAMCATSSRVR
jgi:hypothetical protein